MRRIRFYSGASLALRNLNHKFELKRTPVPVSLLKSLATPSHEKNLELEILAELEHLDFESCKGSTYAQSWRAPSIRDAVGHIKSSWPLFLVYDVMCRDNVRRYDSYSLVKLYEEHLPRVPRESQLQFTLLTLRAASSKWIDFTVTICRLYVRLATPDPPQINDLILKITQVGTTWKSTEIPVIKEAQKALVDAVDQSLLNDKGLFALAYLAHFDSLQLAQDLGGLLANHEYKTLVKLYTCESFEQGLTIINGLVVGSRTAAVWEALMQRLVVLGASEATFLQLFKYFELNKISLSHRMVKASLRGLKSFEHRLRILGRVQLDETLLGLLFGPVTEGYAQAKQLVYSLPPSYSLLSQFINMQADHEPEGVWPTYLLLCKHGDPNEMALEALCHAAVQDPGMMWGAKCAAQQAVVEFKRNVRSMPEDALKIYPTQRLVHQYIRLLGAAGYDQELEQFMPWLQRLEFEPDKRALCALVVYSPYSATIQRLSRGRDGWPTPHEIELYKVNALS